MNMTTQPYTAKSADAVDTFAYNAHFGTPAVPLQRGHHSSQKPVVTVKTETPSTPCESLDSPMYTEYAAPALVSPALDLSSSVATGVADRGHLASPQMSSSGMTIAALPHDASHGHQAATLHYDVSSVQSAGHRYPHIYNPAYFQYNVPGVSCPAQQYAKMYPQQYHASQKLAPPRPEIRSAEQSMDVSPLLGAVSLHRSLRSSNMR